MKHKFLLLYSWLIRTVMYFFPDIPMIMRFRGWCYSFGMKSSGNNFQVASNALIKGLENIEVGTDCIIASNVIVDASTSLIISDEVMVGYSAIIITGNHTLYRGSYRYGKPNRESIHIGKGSWIGGHSLILAGSIIPPSSCIAGNTVMNKKLSKSGIYYRHSELKINEK
ncbi:hypothetical protein C9I86_16815 [Photobacterium sp. NCIMB 13483]|uniref:acyltransferase n=1 Tax=Photobacterium sp. NCIMB 13483 TaxID=2022103 RepID=UPI000D174A10|nr:hypothetical protein [Photobacterium sp. NCIMB 13483]PST85897.1 hypothetical protein C9I86_16815 [Photobacterium sp. NCIMB 13483]